jgi:hypothetical protein
MAQVGVEHPDRGFPGPLVAKSGQRLAARHRGVLEGAIAIG